MTTVVRTAAVCLAVAGASALLTVPHAAAQSSDAKNVNVSASVLRNCRITTTGAIQFGDYDVNAASDVLKQGQIGVACTKGVQAQVTLSAGLNNNRTMNGPVPADKLSYELYQDSNGTAWNTTQIVTYAAPSRGERIFTVHGRIFAGQDMTAGSYADTVVASINF